jgi:CMP-N,N'-diacetyllegionaminic acid synthase
MNRDSFLIFGFGSIGKKHYKLVKKLYHKKKIFIYSKRKILLKNVINCLSDIIKLNPTYIFICSNTKDHFRDLYFFEKNFKNKKILIEKPLFDRFYITSFKNNKIYVGYNLRFDPVIEFIKNKIKNKKIWSANLLCGSYLPEWRKNIKYQNSYSAMKKEGGGVVLDLSHEFDYAQFLFGKLIYNYSNIKKVSDLIIDSEDYCNFVGTTNKGVNLNIHLNYLSRIHYRRIFISGKNFSLIANILNKKVIYHENKKRFIKNFKEKKYNTSYVNQLKNFMSSTKKKTICTYKEGLDTVKIAEKIKKI